MFAETLLLVLQQVYKLGSHPGAQIWRHMGGKEEPCDSFAV